MIHFIDRLQVLDLIVTNEASSEPKPAVDQPQLQPYAALC